MFYKYFGDTVNGNDVIYLYLDNKYEIASDINENLDNLNIEDQAKKYMNDLKIDYRGKNIYLVVDNIIIGKLNQKLLSKKIEYKGFINLKKVKEKDIKEHPSIKFIDIERSNGIIENVKLNEYLFGVIARESINLDNYECLKAQAVIARTYLVKQILNNNKIEEENKYQMYWNKEYLKKQWNTKYEEYKNRIINALRDTNYEVIKYENNLIECYTHYNDCGKTENSNNILKLAYPYLISVPSFDKCKLERTKKISNEDLSKILKTEINENTRIEILEKTSGYNVKYIKFNNKVYDGLLLAKKLGLISNDYSIQINKDYTVFNTKGCGNGLGLSKHGSIEMEKLGYNYKQILHHYYPNTEITKIN